MTDATRITADRPPDQREENSLFFNIDLKPGGREDLFIRISCIRGEGSAVAFGFTEAVSERRHKLDSQNQNAAEINTSNERFNESLKRSLSDINMMLTEKDEDLYPYGGIPWFCTPFGRDGLITALECLWVKPRMAKGVLRFLAKTQATEVDPSKAAEPGKILHEARQGEMAALQEIPFGLYYGSVDSTPLFLMLSAAYWKRTGDDALIRELWPSIKKAITWVQTYGDPDGDGFLEYAPHREGLRNQGWKDSQDSVFHADGTLASGPIALCEVQAYSYAAKKKPRESRSSWATGILPENWNRNHWNCGRNSTSNSGTRSWARMCSPWTGIKNHAGSYRPMRVMRSLQASPIRSKP